MIMTENDYDQLFRQLCKLQTEAPCHNGICIGYQLCEYGINGCYEEDCAIEVVRKKAEYRYNEMAKQLKMKF